MQLTVCLVGRAAYTVEVDGEVEVVRWDNPATLALAVLCGSVKETSMRNSFLDAGGVPAIVQLLGESTCFDTLTHITTLIDALLETTTTSDGVLLSSAIADLFLSEGEQSHVAFHLGRQERYLNILRSRK
jgi:hypothetical protein